MRKLILSFALVMTLLIPMPVYAETTLDDISDGTAEEQANDNDNAVSDYLNDYTPITNDNMAKASVLASPIANFLGNLGRYISGAIAFNIYEGASSKSRENASHPLNSIFHWLPLHPMPGTDLKENHVKISTCKGNNV